MNNYNGNGDNLNNMNQNTYSGEYNPLDVVGNRGERAWGNLTDNIPNNTPNYFGESSQNMVTNEYGIISNTADVYSSNSISSNNRSDVVNNVSSASNTNNEATSVKNINEKSLKKSTKKNSSVGKFVKRSVAVVAAAAVFGGVAGGVFNVVTDGRIFKDNNTSTEASTTEEKFVLGEDKGTTEGTIQTTSVVNKGNLDVSDIAESVMPSVVSITIKGLAESNQGFFGKYQYETEGSGSGIIIGKNETELLIVTNNHVVADATTVSVAFVNDEVYTAKVKGTNVGSDLAVIVVNLDDLSENTLSSIQVAKIGDSDKLKVGEQVVAIGNALGYGQSVTTGIVSAKDRMNDTNNTPLIQTDAAINPGNSGGALLNMNGELVGINSSKYASYDVEGMGYAISISAVQDIINELSNRETKEKVDESEKGYLGISHETITEAVAESQDVPMGVLVRDVADGSAASKAGIEKYNIITKFDGHTVLTSEDLVETIQYYKVGDKVKITLYALEGTEYIEKEVEVTLGKR